ncbi:hypothetical protein VOLCADRAFT_87749 [Volvox carteri f. nagariensis]|uniref:Uncharacterized protein n=1 Tax=Volvox carteri f. nagariensis TaxID=3068 RepID=D8TM53_VOLCA|nr:uncharacterized protein VOLCADRAFT_87749 [Volvox carteri f. nagariensis]EFJ51582.1 hypothetical protein VOLCADRAFT_87749 [Volvox carteri f. nagariensis]|eukprot:XP_002947534.1 hypothetical protein VOLCADRAFT_87749 [Volvox carteri f. nagariensis]
MGDGGLQSWLVLGVLVPRSSLGVVKKQLGPASPTGAVAAAAAVVRTVSSAPVLSPAALAGARLAVTTPGIPLPGMGAPSGPRPTSAQRPLSPRQLLQRLISFPQGHMAQPLQQQQQRQQGAPPPDRAFGPRAADYPARHASPRPALLASYSSGASNGNGNGADYSWQPPQHAPHPPNNAKQRLNDPRVMSGRGGGAAALHTNIWMAQQQQQQHTQQSIPDSPLSSPAGLRPGQGQDYHGQGHGQHDWEVLHSPGRPQSSGPSASSPTRWPGAQQQQHQPQGLLAGGKPGAGNDVVVVGLRDVPPSQLPFARAVVQPEGAGGGPRFEGGLVRAGGGGGGGGSSDDGTNASWWHGGYGACSEASYPLTAVTDRNAVGRGEDDMTPSEAAMWLSRMAELEAEVMEEREFRRKYEEEIRMLAAAATAGGRGGRPSGGGPMLWQTTAGRVVSGARAAAAAVMRHKSGLPP